MKLICIVGKARVGKNTVGDILRLSSAWDSSKYFQLRYPDKKHFIMNALTLHSEVAYSPSKYKCVAFADPLKSALAIIFNIEDVSKFSDGIFKGLQNELELKDSEGYVYTYREIMQKFGTEVGRAIDPDLWVKSTFNYMDPEGNYIITDCRFKNELQACIDKGAITIKVERVVPDMDHTSEHDLDDWSDFNHVIDNNGSLEELVDKVLQLNLV